MILSLDLAQNTGWAAGDGSSPIEWGSFKLEGAEHIRYKQLLREVLALIDRFEAVEVITEMPFNQKVLFGYRAVAMLAGAGRNCTPVNMTSQAHRAHFIGPGRWKRKDAKVAAVAKAIELGYAVQNDDEAEAIAMLSCRLAKKYPDRFHTGLLRQS